MSRELALGQPDLRALRLLTCRSSAEADPNFILPAN
jgi:hypothetical protein